MEKAKQLLKTIIEAVVKNPDQVSVEGKTDERGVLLTLKVAKEDMGLVIGKGGATANALRLLMKVVGKGENANVSLKIAEPEGSMRDASSDF